MKRSPSRTQWITDTIVSQIENGQLAPGTRLQSIRSAADSFGVSKNTVTDAYDRLVATGYVSARRGSGFYVKESFKTFSNTPTRHFTEAIDSVTLLREQLNQNYEVRAGDGRLPASWMENSDINRQLNRITKTGSCDENFEYGSPQGFLGLRESISRTLLDRSISASPDQILMTFGANHALDLIVRHLVKRDDTVLVESPGYYPMFGKLRLQGANIVGVKRDFDGVDLSLLERAMKQHRAKLLFVQPMAHNPTGGSMSLQKMHGLLQLADRYNVTIIEDDPFGDILPRATPHLASLDALQRVIYVGTFSKTFSPSLRCGYVAANPHLLKSLTDIKMLTVVNGSNIVEHIINNFIVSGKYRRHMTRLRDSVSKFTAQAVASLKNIGLTEVPHPSGGFYLWCPLPPHLDSRELAVHASSQSIFLAPGHLFVPPGSTSIPAIRINIAHAGNPKLLSFLHNSLKA